MNRLLIVEYRGNPSLQLLMGKKLGMVKGHHSMVTLADTLCNITYMICAIIKKKEWGLEEKTENMGAYTPPFVRLIVTKRHTQHLFLEEIIKYITYNTMNMNDYVFNI